MIPGYDDRLSDGQERRAVVVGRDLVGPDAVLELEDVDRPLESYRLAVSGPPAAAVKRWDRVIIRYHVGTSIANPARWELVGLEAPCPAPGKEAPCG